MERDTLLEKILDQEWDMFVRVKRANLAVYQSAFEKFRVVRGSVLSLWTEEMLAAYLEQIESAKKQGRNLLTEKYARMNNLIQPLSENPLIVEIVAISVYWDRELQRRYPALCKYYGRDVNGAFDGSNLWIYLRSELETYGGRTLELYYKNILNAYEKGRNLTAETILSLVQREGFTNLGDAEIAFENDGAEETNVVVSYPRF